MTLLMEGTPEKSTGEAAQHGPEDVPATRVRVFTGSAGSAVDERPFMPPTDTSEERPAYRAAGLTLLFRSHLLLIILNIGLVLAIFFLDVSIATDIAIGMLYVAPVAWMALWSSKHDTPLMVTTAVGCTVLSIVAFLLHPADNLWIGFINRIMACFMIWLTTVLSITRKRAEEETKTLRGFLPICSYCKKIRDNTGYWERMEVYISANSQAHFSHGICPECGEEHFPAIYRADHTEGSGGQGARDLKSSAP